MLAIYCRISREKEEGKDRSINDQKLCGIEWAKKLKKEYQVYIDEGISGTNSIADRPEFSRLLDDITENKISIVYAYDQSRLERSPETRYIFKKLLKEYNVKLYVEGGEVDLHDEQSEFFGDLLSLINQYYVKITQKKIKSVLRRNASEGKAHSSILPYGYKKDEKGYLAIDNEEADIVQRIYDLSFSGIGTKTIANRLNDEGVPTRYNKIGKGTISTKNKYTGKITITQKKDIQWASNTIRGIIKNSIYKGERVFSGNIYSSPIIIEPNYWEKVNDNLENNRNNSGKKVNHLYLLKGLLTCSKCGKNYYGRTRVNKKDNYYMCSSKRYQKNKCNNRGINIDALEKFVWDKFFTTPILLEKINEYIEDKSKNDGQTVKLKKELDLIEKKIARLEDSRKRAIKLRIDGLVGEEDIVSELASIKSNSSELKVKLKNVKESLDFILNGASKHKEILKKIWSDDLNILYDENRIRAIDKHLRKRNLSHKAPFNTKLEFINNYIQRIYIDFENNIYIVTIEFKIPLEKEIYLIDKKYTYALNFKSLEAHLIYKDKEHLMSNKLEMLKEKQKEVLS